MVSHSNWEGFEFEYLILPPFVDYCACVGPVMKMCDWHTREGCVKTINLTPLHQLKLLKQVAIQLHVTRPTTTSKQLL